MRNLPSIFDDNRGPRTWRPLLRQIDEMFSDFFSGMSPANVGHMSFDIDEGDDYYLVSVDMPGVPKGNIDIEATENHLIVRGERKQENKFGKEKEGFERQYSKFEQHIPLPDDVRTEEIEAAYENGLLSICIPKSADTLKRKIEVREGKSGILGKILGRQSEKGQDVSENKS